MHDKYVFIIIISTLMLLTINNIIQTKVVNTIFAIFLSGVLLYRFIKYRKYQIALEELSDEDKEIVNRMSAEHEIKTQDIHDETTDGDRDPDFIHSI